jgi:hypothetical protein
MCYSSMRGSDYLLQENKMEAMEPLFLLPGIMVGNYSISTSGLKSSM